MTYAAPGINIFRFYNVILNIYLFKLEYAERLTVMIIIDRDLSLRDR